MLKIIKPSVAGKNNSSIGGNVPAFFGINDVNSGSVSINMSLKSLPAKQKTQPHYHSNCEEAMYVISGKATIYHGADLKPEEVSAGEFVYVPKNEIHQLENKSDAIPFVVIQAQTAPSEQAAGYVFLSEKDLLR